jgi:hypothetical protein
MKHFTAILFFLCINFFAAAGDNSDSLYRPAVMVIPYMPAMHLSDSDQDISEGSEMDLSEVRSSLRKGIVTALNKKFSDVYDVPGMKANFVNEDNSDMDVLYHSLLFGSDSTYPLKIPSRFSIKDTTVLKIKSARKEKSYINVSIADESLIPDFAKKYHADYFIFLNEIDIKTHFDDCLNLALKIYRRELMVHYSIFDKSGKQIYGDVAVSNFESNTNDVKEIANKNFPSIAKYILDSFNKAYQ